MRGNARASWTWRYWPADAMSLCHDAKVFWETRPHWITTARRAGKLKMEVDLRGPGYGSYSFGSVLSIYRTAMRQGRAAGLKPWHTRSRRHLSLDCDRLAGSSNLPGL